MNTITTYSSDGEVLPVLLHDQDLPGPLSHRMLAGMGTVVPLDEDSAFWADYAMTLYGRAQIAAHLTPYGTVCCAMSAAWVWLGGTLPDTVDVLSDSHFRTLAHGRRIRVFNRRPPSKQVQSIGKLRITAPARTAVDLASIRETEADRVAPTVGPIIDDLMASYHVRPGECLTILKDSPRLRHGRSARLFFRAMLGELEDFDEDDGLDDDLLDNDDLKALLTGETAVEGSGRSAGSTSGTGSVRGIGSPGRTGQSR